MIDIIIISHIIKNTVIFPFPSFPIEILSLIIFNIA